MIHFSLHTEYSYLSSGNKIKDYVKHCKENNITHLGITDYCTLSGILDFQTQCLENKINPIFGCQIYVCKDMNKARIPDNLKQEILNSCEPGMEREAIERYSFDNGYITNERDIKYANIWALDNVGLKNLYKVTSLGWIQGYYYKPRVDFKTLIDNNEGLLFGTGDVQSHINDLIIRGELIEAFEIINSLYEVYRDRFIVEIISQDTYQAKCINDFYLTIKDKIPDSTYIVTSNVHYLTKQDKITHQICSAISSRRSNDRDVTEFGLQGEDNFFQTEEDIINILGSKIPNVKQYIENTKQLAQKITARIEVNPFAMIMPKEIGIPENETYETYLQKLCDKSEVWYNLDPTVHSLYQERTKKEINAYTKQKFDRYVLYIKCILDMARSIDCAIGPGRGSAAGSIVNWHLGNTDVDPVKYNLLFERYIDPDRVTPPDNDIDVDPTKREHIIELMKSRWGDTSVAMINTFSALSGKSAFNDVCRVMSVPIETVRKLSHQIQDSLLESFEHEDFKNLEKSYPNILSYVLKVDGLLRQTGIHAAGIVCADKPLWEYVPLETRNDGDKRINVVAFDMVSVEKVGLLKVDLLGLDTVRTIDECVKEVKKSNPQFDVRKIDFEDSEVLNDFTNTKFDGIFQYDSQSSRSLCSNLKKFRSFIDVSHITALNRPGPLNSGMAFEYIKNANTEDHEIVMYHPKIDEILKDTYGIIVYQEQAMRIFKDIQGHEKPDQMRKLIAKSKGAEEIEKHRDAFINGATIKHPDIPLDVLNKLFSDIVTFGDYAFNLSHSVAYAKIAYIQQYLKHYYPLEFWFTMIKNAKDENKRPYVYSAKDAGIGFKDCDIDYSEFDLSYNKQHNFIVSGLSDIKGVGDESAKHITKLKPYVSFNDFVTRTSKKLTNSRVVKALCLAGAMNKIIHNTKHFVERYDDLRKDYESKTKTFHNWDVMLKEDSLNYKDYPNWKKKELILSANPSSLIDPFEEIVAEFHEHIKTSPVSRITNDVCHDNLDRTMYGYWVRGVVTDFELKDPYEKYANDSVSPEQIALSKIEGQIYYIDMVTTNGEDYRVKIKPNTYRHYNNFDLEKGQTLLVYVIKPYQNEHNAVVVFNMSKINKHEDFYLSLFRKWHPLNSKLQRISHNEKKYLEISSSQYIDHVADYKMATNYVFGTIVGLNITPYKKGYNAVNLYILAPNGIFYTKILTNYLSDAIDLLKVGTLIKAKINIKSFRDKLVAETRLEDISYV